jgi:hypothetical protein
MADLLTTIRAELDARLSELRPMFEEYERLLPAAGALASDDRSAPEPRSPHAPARKKAPSVTARKARKRERPDRSPASQAVLAALEHGSHTLAELLLVTALPASEIRDGLRRLRAQHAIVKTDRDGKAAYALPAPVA